MNSSVLSTPIQTSAALGLTAWVFISFVFLAVIVIFGVIALLFPSVQQKLPSRLRKKVLTAIASRPSLPACDSSASSYLPEFLPESCFLDVNGVRVHYVQLTTGKKLGRHHKEIVLLHGIGASTYIWRYLFAEFQSRDIDLRLTAFDLPGFGKSAKSRDISYGLDAQTSLIDQALQQAGIRSPVLVGSSMGGAIALWLGKLFPDRYREIIVLSPATDSSIVPPQVRHLRLMTPYLKRALNRRTMRFFLSRVLSNHAVITDEVINAYLEPFRDEGDAVAAFFSATAILSDRRLPAELAGLSARVLIIFGELDQMVSRRSIERLKTVIPKAHLISHLSGGHHIMEDEPHWLADQLESFIEQNTHSVLS